MASASTTSNNGGPRQTDVRKRTVLPTTLQNMRTSAIGGVAGPAGAGAGAGAGGGLELSSDEYLDKMEEELNRKVDGDTEVLVDGMAELVRMTKVRCVLVQNRTGQNKHRGLNSCDKHAMDSKD